MSYPDTSCIDRYPEGFDMANTKNKTYLYPPVTIAELRSSVREGRVTCFGYPALKIVEVRSQARIEESPEAHDSFAAIQQDRDCLKDEVKEKHISSKVKSASNVIRSTLIIIFYLDI